MTPRKSSGRFPSLGARWALALALLSPSATTSCASDPETGLRVRIDSDLRSEGLEQVLLQVTEPSDTNRVLLTRRFHLGTGSADVSLPGAFVLTPEGAMARENAPYRVRVGAVFSGRDDAQPEFFDEAIVRFEQGRFREIEMYLARACRPSSMPPRCEGGQVCGAGGACVELARYSGGEDPPDAGPTAMPTGMPMGSECDFIRQNCSGNENCVPVTAGGAVRFVCARAGGGRAGERCAVTWATCGRGLVCGRTNVCGAPCDRTSAAPNQGCTPGTTCLDAMLGDARYGVCER